MTVASLRKALRAILVGEESSTLAAQGTIGEAGGTDANGMEIVTQDVSDAFTPDETEFNIFNTDEKLAAIESLATMLRSVPGRKSVIHFSSGITRTGQENQATLRAATDAANQADVSLYTMDARGLAALPPGGDASSSSPSGTAIYSGSAVASQVSSLQGSRETLAALATDTGGRTFYDLNDFTPAFEEVQKENSSYYLIGYSPTNTRDDGRFRHIRVEVARPGLKVQARPGYFAPKNFRQFTRQEKEVQLQQVMDLDVPFVDLPFVVETAYFRRPDKKFTVVLAAKIPGSQVAFMKKSGKHETEFDFAWKITDAQNHTAGGLRDTLPVRMTNDTYDEIIGSNLFYEGEVVLPPGKYNLKAVVRENESGKIGTFEAPLVVPDIADTGLGLSSIVLSNEVKSSDDLDRAHVNRDKNSPLQVGNRSVLPSVTRVFRTNQMLSVYLESYAGKSCGVHRTRRPALGGACLLPPGKKIRGSRTLSREGREVIGSEDFLLCPDSSGKISSGKLHPASERSRPGRRTGGLRARASGHRAAATAQPSSTGGEIKLRARRLNGRAPCEQRCLDHRGKTPKPLDSAIARHEAKSSIGASRQGSRSGFETPVQRLPQRRLLSWRSPRAVAEFSLRAPHGCGNQ